MHDFKVGDYVYASDWCFGMIVEMLDDGAYVEFDTDFGGGTTFFEYDEMKLAADC